jgi:hypothetical protein
MPKIENYGDDPAITGLERLLSTNEDGITKNILILNLKQYLEGNLDTNVITDQTEVTAVAGDYLLIVDATDGQYKKVDAEDFLNSGGTMAANSIRGNDTGSPAPAQDLTASEVRALLNIEDGATADQSDSEIETAYNNQVSVVSQAIAEAGTSTTVYRWTPLRVAQAIAALETSGTSYTDEEAQDAVGTILTDSSEIDFTYDDGTPSITASLIAGSIDETKLDTSVNASLDLADSAIQPGDNISSLTNDSGFITGYTVTQGDVTAHEAALTITESQISDLNHSVDFVSNVATSTILGRVTGGLGNSEELTASQVRTLLNIEDGSTADQTGAEIESLLDAELGNARWKVVELPAGGTANQVLEKIDGTDYNVQWTTLSAGGDVTAASAFGTDNVLVRSDGTGKGVQASGISIDDLNNISGIGDISLTGTVDGVDIASWIDQDVSNGSAPTFDGSNISSVDALTLGGISSSGFALSSHTHFASDITSGTLAVARGGTGVTSSTGTGNNVLSASPVFTGTPVLPSTFTIGSNSFGRSGAHGLTLTTTATTTATFPSGSITVVGANATQTLQNKTLTSPVVNTQISGTVTSGGNITTTNYLVGATATQTLSNKTLASPAVTGNLTTTGLIDGRDVAADGTTLDALPSITVGTTAPGSPSTGDLWVDTN